VTSTGYQLFDGIPWPLEKARDSLYNAYFKGEWLHDHFQREMRRIKALNPDMPDRELVRAIVKAEPFNKLPTVELEPLLQRFEKPYEFIHFLQQNMHHYRKFLAPQSKKP
jgi:hypothetical protein